jgi:ATP-dependent 26S proteasome regulatory subunit
MKEQFVNQLASYIESLQPIIHVNDFDFVKNIEIILEIAEENTTVYEYAIAGFYRDLKTQREVAVSDVFSFLKSLDEKKECNLFVVFQDIDQLLNDPIFIFYLKTISFKNLTVENYNITFFIISNNITFPIELKNFAVSFKPPTPNQSEILQQVSKFVTELNIDITKNELEKISFSLLGLSEYEISRVLSINYQSQGSLHTLNNNIYNQILSKNNIIEVIDEKRSFNSIGGLNNIKNYIYQRTKIFQTPERAVLFGVDLPKGIFLIGDSGSGKSSIVKAISYSFNVILIKLNIKKIVSKNIAKSEEQLLNTLKNIELMGRTVVWLDRLDELFLDFHNRDRIINLLGIFFSWIKQKKEFQNISFAVVTANNIDLVPHEIFRSNSFDEVFEIGLPDIYEREEIITIHLKNRNQKLETLDIKVLKNETQGLKGSEIESSIRKSIEKAFIESERKITTEDILEQIKIIKKQKETSKTHKNEKNRLEN